MSSFGILLALAGGVLIGTAAALLLYVNGRIAGISSIVGSLLLPSASSESKLAQTTVQKPEKKERLWRLVFLIGVILGTALFYAFSGNIPSARDDFPGWLLIIAGLLVGFGTSLSNGCTSGHGVCGLGRFSLRSLLATILFLVTGIITAVLFRQVFGIL